MPRRACILAPPVRRAPSRALAAVRGPLRGLRTRSNLYSAGPAVLGLLVSVALLSLSPTAQAERRIVEGIPLADPAETGESGLAARLFFSANLMGSFEPCECADLPLGGIAQAAAQVDSARVDGPPVFWVDAGNRLFRYDMAMTGTEEAERRARAILLVDSGSVGGLDALGVGRLDLGAGIDYLRLLQRRASFPFLSANLRDDRGELLFQASVLLERDGQKIGVTSVLPEGTSGLGYSADNPFAAAKREVGKLRGRGADLVVVLSNLGTKQGAKLARASKPDVILSSQSRKLTPEPEVWGKTIGGEPSSRGRYLGDLRIYEKSARRGDRLVLTTVPVRREGPQHPRVRALVESTLARLADPVLGVPPIPIRSFEEKAFRERGD